MKMVFREGRALTRHKKEKKRWGRATSFDEAMDWHDDKQSFPPCFRHRPQAVVPRTEACHQNLRGHAQ